ncbi:Uncharacterised protein r2_g4338 [Pycnogonum litorale]
MAPLILFKFRCIFTTYRVESSVRRTNPAIRLKNTFNFICRTCENAKETVDGCYGNVKRQLEQKKQRAVKETRRQSWSGDRDQSSSVVATGLPSTDKSHHSHSSLSSMESDNDETFFDAQDSSSVCKRTNSKPKRPSSLGDADIAGVPTEATGTS